MKNTIRKKGSFGYKVAAVIVSTVLFAQAATGEFNPFGDEAFFDLDVFAEDSTDTPPTATAGDSIKLKFPIRDQLGTHPHQNRHAFDLEDPQNLDQEVVYDPDSNQYIFREKVGERDVRDPYIMDFEEYYKYQSQRDEQAYFRERLDAMGMFDKKPELPTLYREGIFDRLFGGQKISIKPQGNLDIMAGIYSQNLKNPNIPKRSQKYTIPDFDMKMNVGLIAQIGDKMKLNVSNNTASTFGDMQEMRKIEYTGKEDEIIKKIEAGNVTFPLRSTLTPSMSSLFGLKTQLQFGKLWVTSVVSQQKSQRRSMSVRGGAQTTPFEIKINDYEENRNFLLAQYFYQNYDRALENFPIINSQVMINKVEVWITNRTGSTQGVRDALAFMDLGESNPYNNLLIGSAGDPLPDNRSNLLYQNLQQNPAARMQSSATQAVLGMGLREGQDFHRATMRKLNSSEFTFQPQLGYISISAMPSNDDIIAVAYRYTYNGKVYQVGEFSEDMPPDSSAQKMLYLKLLKGTSARVNLPIWDLMMKNVYSLQAGAISKEDFKLNVVYQDPGGGYKRYLPEGPRAGTPMITLLNLDRLNFQNDPMPDGIFDFVEGITINAQQGKVIFPTIQPFGKTLKPALGNDPALERKYLYQVLYDSTKTVALQQQQNNRFLIKGEFQSAGGAEIRLNGFNIPPGSVTITAGGQRLVEGVDYQVDYGSGTVKILNQGILNSGVALNVQYEDNAAFGQVSQGFLGTRLDYYLNNKLSLGATYMRLTERPMTQKVIMGYDPIKNTVLALDANYQSEAPGITRALDRFLPIYSTNAPSLVTASAEVAGIFPGHSKFINIPGDDGGSVFLDDFEGAANSYDIRYPANGWTLSSAPVDAQGPTGNILFPEATLNNDLRAGINRANMAWYNIEPSLNNGSVDVPNSIKNDTARQDYWRQVQQKELFPNKSVITAQSVLTTFDLKFNPKERGPYNFDATNLDPSNGNLLNPSTRWGGIQRSLEQSDFEQSNVEYITFWMLDPFIYDPNSKGGYLYFNLGNVSEDILKDSRLAFENGISFPKDLNKLDRTIWGYVPRFQQQVVRAFEQNPEARPVQDVGYDLLSDEEERTFFEKFLAQVSGTLGPNSDAFLKLQSDPATDNFKHFRNGDYDAQNAGILKRYEFYNHPQGNAPILQGDNATMSAGSSLPESEDINRDNALNESESYYQYRVRIEPNMQVNSNFVVDKVTAQVKLPNGRMSDNTWYQFKIPIKSFDKKVGDISDFRAIRFIRMFMNGFEDETVLRFAQLQFDRSIWRRYNMSLVNPGENIPEEDQRTTSFGITTVNVDQNSSREPVPYVMPPGIQKQQQIATTGQTINADEQSLSLQICGLKDGDARAAFKEIGNDLRQFRELKMFIHAESVPGQPALKDGDVVAFIRIGSDYIRNYYEYQVPLKITLPGTSTAEGVWPEQNNLRIILQELVNLKKERNAANHPTTIPFERVDGSGRIIKIIGNPNFGEVKNIMLGMLNPKKTTQTPADDGMPKCAEIWFDELRVVGLDERPGYAATGHVNVQLADLGTVHLGGIMHTNGYGSIDQRVNDRYRDNFYQYEGNANINLGKLMPNKWGVQLPVFVGYNESVSNPEYDPYDVDITLKDKLRSVSGGERDSILRAAQDYLSITSFNVNNVRILGNPEKQRVPMPWSAKNFDLSYSYLRQFSRNPMIESDELTDQKLGLGYVYNIRVKTFEPFKKMIKNKSPWLNAIKDFNFNYLPSSFTFRNDLHRVFNETILRNVDDGNYQLPPYYFKNFIWNRNYNLRWELTRSLSFNYQANNISRIDEPYGRLDSREKRDTFYNRLMDFGRNTYFTQRLDVSYSLPTKKFPFLDWTTASVIYNSFYDWSAASLLAKNLGNTITNTQLKQINGELNFTQLYNKSRYLRAANRQPLQKTAKDVGRMSETIRKGNDGQRDAGGGLAPGIGTAGTGSGKEMKGGEAKDNTQKSRIPPRPERKVFTAQDVKGSDTMTVKEVANALKALRKTERRRYRDAMIAWWRSKQNILPELGSGERALVRFGTMLKRVTFDYSENSGTILPGYMDSTNYLGTNFRNGAHNLDFAFGYQPNRYWFDQQMRRGNLSKDSLFNGMAQQQYAQAYNIRAALEPFRDFRLDLNWSSNFTRNQAEINKYNHATDAFDQLNPYYSGSFDVTYIGAATLFRNSKAGKTTQTYQSFMENRRIISGRLGNSNPYTNGVNDPNDPTFKKGYTGFAQDVLIPAFIAAYTGKDASKVPLLEYDYHNIKSNPFRFYFPMPNWRLTYSGLTYLSDMFSNVTIDHTYTGRLSMNSFTNMLFYQDMLGVGFPSFIDSNSHNYIPFFQVPNVTITENFGPFLGINAVFKNDLNFRLKYNRSRMVSMSLIDYQVSETNSTEWELGLGYRVKGLVLPFSIFGVRQLKNDVNFTLVMGLRDDLTSTTYMASNENLATMGQKVITISPTIDYIVNDYLQLSIYYDRRQSLPYVLTSYPLTSTKAGIRLRFTFAGQ